MVEESQRRQTPNEIGVPTQNASNMSPRKDVSLPPLTKSRPATPAQSKSSVYHQIAAAQIISNSNSQSAAVSTSITPVNFYSDSQNTYMHKRNFNETATPINKTRKTPSETTARTPTPINPRDGYIFNHTPVHNYRLAQNDQQFLFSNNMANSSQVNVNMPMQPAIPPEQAIIIRKAATTQMLNDLGHLSTIIINEKLVTINLYDLNGNGKAHIEQIHEVIFMARSDFFRRSWRNFEINGLTNGEYSFSKKFDSEKMVNAHNVDISLSNPDELDKTERNLRFDIQIDDSVITEEFDYFKRALAELKRFLYSGDCEISPKIAYQLINFAICFEVPSLIEFICEYFLKHFQSTDNYIHVFDILEISYNYQEQNPKLNELKHRCIEIINREGLKVIYLNKYTEMVEKYPDLFVDIFYADN